MPLYEYLCQGCGRRAEVFVRRAGGDTPLPKCAGAPDGNGEHHMVRIVSKFSRHLTESDKLVEAEAKWGAEMESVMGPGPDVASLARRYERLSKDLPPPDALPEG